LADTKTARAARDVFDVALPHLIDALNAFGLFAAEGQSTVRMMSVGSRLLVGIAP
jgi:hypothetical protein